MDINKLSIEQKYALEKFKRGENLFITGPGGTGKTTLIKNLIYYAKSNKKKIQVCALTGCAAVILNCNARTIHSWSGIKLARGEKTKIIDNILKSRKLLKEWKKLDILIVDEVSMMSQKIFELLNEIGKRSRLSTLAFGGIQVVFTGDFFQLPPVSNVDEPESENFCFESPSWYEVFKLENHIELQTVFRQNDKEYINILSEIRKGELTKENINILEKYVKRNWNHENPLIVPTKLFPTRIKADYINSLMFSKLDEDEYHFEYSIKTDCKLFIDSGKSFNIEQTLKCEKMTNEEIEYEINNLINNTCCEKLLKLKKGAFVLCRVNIDMENKICNGTQGVVTNIINNGDNTSIEVMFSNGIKKILEPYFWQSEEYPRIAIKQFPLCLAWALTIHKIQGATLSMAEIDIGNSIFEYGQTYVALSRIQSLDGLYLSEFDPTKIRANPKVKEFYKKIKPIHIEEIETQLNRTENRFVQFELKEDEYIDKKIDNNIKIIKL